MLSFLIIIGENATNEVAKLTGSLLQNPEVMAAFEQKLAGMVGRKSGYIEGYVVNLVCLKLSDSLVAATWISF